jgi:Hsp20/alpha crystallin family
MFTADVPGVEQANLEISVTGNRLTVSGKREEAKEERGESYYACERNDGRGCQGLAVTDDGTGLARLRRPLRPALQEPAKCGPSEKSDEQDGHLWAADGSPGCSARA